ncbi:MAG: hypothetical protein HY240_10830 [Actinobacteria bacterium]|nr:hypothetical protein [Actinomycetota bacterium]
MRSRFIAIAALFSAVLMVGPQGGTASALACAGTVGVSNGTSICVVLPNAPSTSLTGDELVSITSDPNSGVMYLDWSPSGGSSIRLMVSTGPSPETGDYSFIWPTEKYLNGSGTLDVRSGSTAADPVSVDVTLDNGPGNDTDFQHSPTDCGNGCPPAAWTGAGDPVVAAVGDGPSDEAKSNSVADSLVAESPALFLFLGDIYETGTFTENRNHYGASALDGTPGTLWGRLAAETQPAVGNHEKVNLTAWRDYWHGHPTFSSFTFGGALFIDLNSSASFKAGSAQYKFVSSLVTDPGAPSCIVAFWHIPTITGGNVRSAELPMWQLFADNGGDLVLDGHTHNMTQYVPLDRDLSASADAHMVELIAGSGGHRLSGASSDAGGRILWSKGKTVGALYLTLQGAGGGGTATSITWTWLNTKGDQVPGSPDGSTVTC